MPGPTNPLPTQFTSERLLLRCYQAADSTLYCRMLQQNQAHLHEFLPDSLAAIQTPADAEKHFQQLTAAWQARSLFIFGVWEMGNGRYVGETYLANADWDLPCLELGYFVVQNQTGQGFASEAAQATIRYAFAQLNVSRVELQCAADNIASQRVAERCGFTLEGRQRLRQRQKDGALLDRLWYGLLAEEWEINDER